MAGKGSKKDIESVLMQAMLAAKTVRAQRDRLLQLQQRLQDLQADATPAVVEADADADAKLRELASNLFKVYYIGLEAGARILTTCVHLAAEKGIRFSPPNLAFAVMPDEQLHDALLAQQFPARPRIAGLAVKHIDVAVAVAVLSRFMDPKKLASLAEFCDDHAYISEEGFYDSI
ncbi:hypothetical protein CFC21_037809 [Triticum aestivum]|uniref:Uncharacterized protein n=3 Tax=Triticum TaxID=4564 RepID=A0A9R0RXR1_TRITD|nr:hypothetical protein CFC21_037809 [Triticum aestivum]VAH68364.1 unnamed protein product [Triticum turgidum subsp. durum]